MAYITLSGVTIPTPQPYSDKDPLKQQENLAYVQLQVCQQLQAANFRIPDAQEVTRLVQEIQTLNTNLVNITTAIQAISLTVTPTDLTALTQAVENLAFNDTELDFGFMEVHLRGIVKDTI